MLSIGGYDLVSVVTSRFRLDGGAMFGVVPKVLWEKLNPPDPFNRISLTMRTLVAVDRGSKRVILVDTGAGHKWPPDEAARYAIEVDPTALADALATFGLSEDDVTDVVVTHLHFDHNGGLTEWADRPGGPTRLRFARARHWLHRRHRTYAQQPSEKDRASFLTRDFECVCSLPEIRADAPGPGLVLVDDEPGPPRAAAMPGVRWFVSCGHTFYQLLPVFFDARLALMFTGDVVPTAAHLRHAWVMAYDLQPLETIAEKHRIYAACRDEQWILAFPHDPAIAGARIAFERGHPVVAETLGALEVAATC